VGKSEFFIQKQNIVELNKKQISIAQRLFYHRKSRITAHSPLIRAIGFNLLENNASNPEQFHPRNFVSLRCPLSQNGAFTVMLFSSSTHRG